MNLNSSEKLLISSPDFVNGGRIPIQFTGRGEDYSPELRIDNISKKAVSIALHMDDLSHPIKGYNHWCIWDISPMNLIPSKIPEGKIISPLGGAVQGVGYGKHKYRGPKPPKFMKKPHKYIFYVYVLDSKLNLPSDSRKKDLLKAMDGHVIQQGEICGLFGNDLSST